MHPDVDRYRAQLTKNPARGKILRSVEERLATEGDDQLLADLLGERIAALELAGARPKIIEEVAAHHREALMRHAENGAEPLAAAHSALQAAAVAKRDGDGAVRVDAALWALIRCADDEGVLEAAIEHMGALRAAREIAKQALSRPEFTGQRGELRHAMSRLAEAAGDTDVAFFESLRAARTTPPVRHYLDEAFRLALVTGRFQETAAVYHDLSHGDELLEPELRTYVQLKLAHLLARHLDRGAEALEIFTSILTRDPDNAEANKRAHKLAEQLGVDFPALTIELTPQPPREERAAVPSVDSPAARHPSEEETVRAATDDALPVPDEGIGGLDAPPDIQESAPRTPISSEEMEEVAKLELPNEEGDVFASSKELPPELVAAVVRSVADGPTDTYDLPLQDPEFPTAVSASPAALDTVEFAGAEPAFADLGGLAPADDDDLALDETNPAGTPLQRDDAFAVAQHDALPFDDDDLALDETNPAAAALPRSDDAFTVAQHDALPFDDDDLALDETNPAAAALPRDHPLPWQDSDAGDAEGDDRSDAEGDRGDAEGDDDAGGFGAPDEIRTQEVGEAQIIEVQDDDDALEAPTSFAVATAINTAELEAAGDHESLAAALVDTLSVRPSLDELLRLADIYEMRLASPERAFPFYARALEAYDDERAQAGLLRCAPGAPDAAATLCDSLLEKRGARDDAVASLVRIVAANEVKGGALGEGAARLAAVFNRRTNDEGLFHQLDRLYERLDEPSKRAELRARANFGDAVSRLGLLRERMRLFEEAGDLRAAMDAARSLQAAQPKDVEIASQVVSLAERIGDLAVLKEALLSRLGLEGDDDAMATARRLAHLAEESGDVTAARSGWREVLRHRPGDAEALRALSDLLEGDEALHDELAQVLALRLSIARETDDEALQLIILHRLADLHAARGRPDAEEAALREALAVDPEDHAALEVVAKRMRARRAPEELAAFYDTLAALRESPEGQVQMWLESARIHRTELGARDAARVVYEKALQASPTNGDALSGMAELCREQGNYSEAVSYLERAIEQQSGDARSEPLYLLGQLQERELDAIDAAAEAYRRALEADPAHSKAHTALTRLLRAGKRWGELAALLEAKAQHATTPEVAAGALSEAARALLETGEGEDLDKAEKLLEEALQRAPTSNAAREQLIDLALGREDYAAARPRLEDLIRNQGPDELSLEHLTALARACVLEGATEPAEDHLRRVLKRAPSHLDALRILGDLLVADGDADAEETITVLEQRLLHHGPSLDRREAARVHGHIGILRRGLGDHPGARKALQHALTLMDDETPDLDVLAAHAELLSDEGEVTTAMLETERLARRLEGPQAASRWMQLGNLAETQLEDLDRAAEAYAEASQADPDRLDAFEGLLRVEIARGNTQRAMDAAEGVLERELNPQRLSRLEAALAAICQSNLQDPARAATYLQRAIEHDPENRAAIDAAEQLFEEMGEFQKLDQLLSEAAGGGAPLSAEERVDLLEKLAQVRRYQLRDLPGAAKCLEQVIALDGESVKAREDLGRIYTELDRFDDALRTWREVLPRNPLSPEAYRAMFTLLRRQREYDAAYSVAATMVALEVADAETRAVVKQLRSPFPNWPSVPPNPKRVADALLHPRARGPVREILARVAPVMWHHFAHTLREFGLRRRDLLGSQEIPNSLALALRQAARVLEVPEPPIYRGGKDVVGISLLPIDPPALLVGNDVLRGGMTAERAFAFGRAVAYLRPASLLVAALPPTELRGIAEAVLLMSMPRIEMDAATREINRLAQLIEREAKPVDVDHLVELGREYYKIRASNSMQQFVSAVSYTTDRVGFLFAGELAPAVAAIKAAAGQAHLHPARLAIKELVLFSVSPEHFILRKELGLAVRRSDAERVLKA